MQPGASWPAGFGAGQRRFEAIATRGSKTWASAIVVSCVVLFAGLAALSSMLPNPSSARSVFSTMAPWLGTIVLVGILSVVLGSLGVFDTMQGQMTAMPLFGVIVVAGLVLTMVRSLRKSPRLEIEEDSSELRLRDPKSGLLLAAAPLRAISTARGIYRSSGRLRFEFAALAIRIPGYRDMTLCVHDTRFGWSDTAARWSAPRYIVGPPDWNALVELLGLRQFVTVHEDYPV